MFLIHLSAICLKYPISKFWIQLFGISNYERKFFFEFTLLFIPFRSKREKGEWENLEIKIYTLQRSFFPLFRTRNNKIQVANMIPRKNIISCHRWLFFVASFYTCVLNYELSLSKAQFFSLQKKRKAGTFNDTPFELCSASNIKFFFYYFYYLI